MKGYTMTEGEDVLQNERAEAFRLGFRQGGKTQLMRVRALILKGIRDAESADPANINRATYEAMERFANDLKSMAEQL